MAHSESHMASVNFNIFFVHVTDGREFVQCIVLIT
jgi:hypothetical protein